MMKFNLQEFLADMRQEHKDDTLMLVGKIDGMKDALAKHDTRITVVENTRKVLLTSAGALGLALLGFLLDMATNHLPKLTAAIKSIIIVLVFAAPANAQSNAEKQETKQLLEKYFVGYALPMSKPQIGELLNRVATERPGWKLLGKKAGNNCPMPNGTPVSCDYLVFGTQGFDVFFSEGAADSRVTGPSGDGEDMTNALANGSRALVEPVGASGPVDDSVLDRIQDLEDATQALKNEVLRLEGLLRSDARMFAQLREQINALITRIETLENKPVPLIPTDCYTSLPFLGCGLKFE